MKILSIVLLLMMSSVGAYCQEYTVLELPKIPSPSVQLQTETALISFFKDDLILTLELLKETCGSVNKEWYRECSEAILIIKESENRIDIEENHKYENSALNSLHDLLKNEIAAALILQKKVKIIRKDTGKNQSKILLKSLTTEGLHYIFSFTDQSIFFKGDVNCTVEFK